MRPGCRQVAALAVAAGLAGCAPAPPTHVVLVSIDSLRADHLGCYGYPEPTSPRIDALAAEGTLVEQVTSSTSWTLPAHAALFTGLVDDLHKVTDPSRALGPDLPTLAERLAGAGFATGAFVSGPFLHPRFGLQRGFADYRNCMGYLDAGFRAARPMDLHTESHRDRPGACVVDGALEWLGAHRDGPAFLFLHFWEVHYDYAPPADVLARFDPGYAGGLDPSGYARNDAVAPDMAPRDLRHVVARYDAEIAVVDTYLGRLLDGLDALGLGERSLVVVTSDHGEAFFEHGEKGHKKDLHVESLRIPLVLRGPGVPEGRRSPGPASITDVAPTVLDLLGLPPLAEGLGAGRSLLPAFRDPQLLEDRQVYALLRSAGRNAASLEGRTHKVIRDRSGRVVAYDLRSDPGEQSPLVFPFEHARRLDDHVRALRRRAESFPPPTTLAQPDASVEAELRALGYIE